jgi:hypothetical protein
MHATIWGKHGGALALSTGTLLDSLRFREHLGRRLNVALPSIVGRKDSLKVLHPPLSDVEHTGLEKALKDYATPRNERADYSVEATEGNACDTTKGGFRPPLSLMLLDHAPQRGTTNLLTVVPAVPGAQGSPSGPRLVIGLRVDGISRFRAAPSARTAID